jgi:signal transduction histidine kinase
MRLERYFNTSIFICLAFFQISWGIYARKFGLYMDDENSFLIRVIIALSALSFAYLNQIYEDFFNKIRKYIFLILSFGVSIQQLYYMNLYSTNDHIIIATIPPILVSILFVPNVISLIILTALINISSLFFTQENYFISFNLFTYSSVIFIFKYYSLKYLDHIRKQESHKSKINKLFHLGEFSRGLSHKINNQTMKINLLANTINNNPENKIKKLKDEINILIETTENLNIFMEDNINIKTIKFKKILNEIISMKKNFQEENKNIKITFQNTINKNQEVNLDLEQISIVLNELINNAIYASKEDQNPSVKISTYIGDEFIYFEFQNNGKTIDKKDQEHIFDAFFTTKDISQGTGLGLALVSKIAYQHQGAVELDCKYLNSTIFRFKIPLKKEGEV